MAALLTAVRSPAPGLESDRLASLPRRRAAPGLGLGCSHQHLDRRRRPADPGVREVLRSPTATTRPAAPTGYAPAAPNAGGKQAATGSSSWPHPYPASASAPNGSAWCAARPVISARPREGGCAWPAPACAPADARASTTMSGAMNASGRPRLARRWGSAPSPPAIASPRSAMACAPATRPDGPGPVAPS